jgi:hypothetical protein
LQQPRKIVLLLYDFDWGRSVWKPTTLDPYCEVTTDISRLPTADAVVFHVPTAPDLSQLKKYPFQTWVAWSMESDVFYPQLKIPAYLRNFDLTMTYRWDSDVPCMYTSPDMRAQLLAPPKPKTEVSPAVLFLSNLCDRWGRTDYINQLMSYLKVDSYGRSMRNRQIENDTGRGSKMETISRYKFTLSFENSISRDYVTEKFFEPLMAGSIPVYVGAPNIEDFAPGERCYINALRFARPQELAEYLLHVAGNPAEYQRYLQWKSEPLREGFSRKLNLVERDAFYRLADLLRRSGTLSERN